MSKNQKLWLRVGWVALVAMILMAFFRDSGTIIFISLGATFAVVSMRLSGWKKSSSGQIA